MKRILVDMDDVICVHGFINIVNDFLGTKYTEDDAKSYYINDLIPKEKMKEWVEFFKNKNVYDYMELNKDVQEVLKKLNAMYEIYIVTAYIFRDDPTISGNQLKNKFDFLQKHLPFINPENFIFLSDKSLINADVRIDDNIQKLEGTSELKLLFTAYHNKNLTEEDLEKQNVKRVNDWKEIEKILLPKRTNLN